MSGLIDHILALHGIAALAVIFVVPALESSAFVGFIFPGEIAVLLGGVLAFQHRIPLGAAIGAAIAGAIVGDTIGYFVGRRWGRRMIHGTLGRFLKHEHIDRAEKYLRERGGRAVFFGRFTAALRVFIPGLAGMSGLDYRTFAINNVAGGALWATGFVLLGDLAGASWRRVEHVAKRASLLVLAVVVLIVVLTLVVRRVGREQERIERFVARQLDRPRISRLRRRYHRQIEFLADRLRPEGAFGLALTTALVALVATGWALGAVIQDVIAHEELVRIDQPVLRFFAHHREPWLTIAMLVLSRLGATAILVPLILIIGITWRLVGKTWRPLPLLAGAYAGTSLMYSVIKPLVGRARPPLALATGHFVGLSFPSGHAAQAAAVYGMLAALVAGSSEIWTRKVTVWGVAVFVALLVGVSRLYLGAHWLSDVLGGYALGGMWLFALIAFVRIVTHRPILADAHERRA
jgi:membrane protein DedA with SNARE-associated domain/membrane-associated phospholipid phosphatase